MKFSIFNYRALAKVEKKKSFFDFHFSIFKGGFWLIAIVIILGLILAIFFLPQPKETIPGKEIIPEETLMEQPKLIPPSPLISVKGTKILEISDKKETLKILSQILKEKLESDSFTQILIKDTKENKFISPQELSEAFGIEIPEEIYQKLEKDSTLSIYLQKEGRRFAFVAEIKNGEVPGLAELLKAFEPKMQEGVFKVVGKELDVLSPYFKDGEYEGVAFRYQTFSKTDFGICYSIFKNYFILTTSYQSLEKALDNLMSL